MCIRFPRRREARICKTRAFAKLRLPCQTPSVPSAPVQLRPSPLPPGARNAVDAPTAKALTQAFLAFEADETASVAVFWGEGGTFCAGADLKAVSEGRASNPIVPVPVGEAGRSRLYPNGPMGPSRLVLSKPVIAAVEGHAVAAGWSSPAGPICASWPRKRSSESSAGVGACR